MDVTATVKGQIVIPVELRRKLKIKKGTRLRVSQEGDKIVLQPINENFIRGLRGKFRGAGLLEELRTERRRDKARE